MFTGIIEGLGTVAGMRPSGLGRRLTVDADFDLSGTKTGDSLSVSGACLTAITVESRRFQADVSPETLKRTIFQKTKIGDRVNLERALVLSDRIDGHLVSGHVDGTGLIRAKQPAGNATLVTIEVPAWMSRYIIGKGSVAVDGISLTVNTCGPDRFEVSIIPHTGKLTTVGLKQNGAHVNIETDMIGKYVERFMDAYPKEAAKGETSKVDMNLLARTGFLNT